MTPENNLKPIATEEIPTAFYKAAVALEQLGFQVHVHRVQLAADVETLDGGVFYLLPEMIVALGREAKTTIRAARATSQYLQLMIERVNWRHLRKMKIKAPVFERPAMIPPTTTVELFKSAEQVLIRAGFRLFKPEAVEWGLLTTVEGRSYRFPVAILIALGTAASSDLLWQGVRGDVHYLKVVLRKAGVWDETNPVRTTMLEIPSNVLFGP